MSSPPVTPLVVAPLRFWHRGAVVQLGNVPPDRTLLALLREDLHLRATKEACAAGDCGACTVVLAEADPSGLRYRAVNSCIKPAHAIDGQALWTATDLALADGTLHPVQQAMLEHHGSQCGFCTPGFVMSLFGLYQRRVACGDAVDRHSAQEVLSGNLCRCTGYRPILDAACALQADARHALDETAIAQALAALPPRDAPNAAYQLPRSLDALLQARAAQPQAQLIAGATDAGLWITQHLQAMPQIIDLTRVAELRRIEIHPQHIAIGAAVSLQDAFDALAAERPCIRAWAQRFAGWPIRQSGTLGGNVANGSPIGDSMPLLIALGAQTILMAWRDGRAVHRHVPLEDLYTGYRRHVMARDEVLAWIVVPRPQAGEWLGVYKVSKRMEDDISAVCLALQLQLDTEASGPLRVRQARIGAGGVAATPARARQTEDRLNGQHWDAQTLQQAQSTLENEFHPIDDLRASGHYRRRVLGALLERAWRESTGQSEVRLEALA
ncbi:MAG: xanthine dehydrogenase small subunit [Betaproteobacteria bacterium]|nr:xanthine dehydrogenase small subunit [Betaproteobacteria bacterium]